MEAGEDRGLDGIERERSLSDRESNSRRRRAAIASDRIRSAIMAPKAKGLPVVVSMGSVAASKTRAGRNRFMIANLLFVSRRISRRETG